MSNNKQSSVEWLIGQLKISTYWNTLIAELEFMDLEIDDIIEQAKAMHKDETIDFAMKFMMQDRPVVTFYNETFNNNEQH